MYKKSHLGCVEGQRAKQLACANLHSGSLKWNDEPFGTIRLEAAYAKNHRESPEGKEDLLIIFGGVPPSLLGGASERAPRAA